ncbi:MAG: pitrilysin family protein [Pseudanabaenaceae cyanobacterium bins.68]|nr:pitrilysin family protein [Pseudanabaenaceae cyanobacterium bins.68]
MIQLVLRSLAVALVIILGTNFMNLPFTPWVFAKDSSEVQLGKLTENVSKTVLANGLTLLLKPVKTAPVATVQVWYRVGSQNERRGITGISHQLEHLLFKGTVERPIQFGRLFSALGSSSNAFTSYDMTAYYGTVGADKLAALLELESDRMVNTVAGEAELKSERTVVLSELDGGNNNPGTRLYRAVMRAAFPESSYGWMVIGDRGDVESFTAADVQAYYRRFYRPDNATVVIVGDFDSQAVINQVEATFGKIPRPSQTLPDPFKSQPAKSIPKSQEVVLREPGSVPLLQVVYPNLPRLIDPDVPALDLLDTILTSGKSSRLYQSLVQSGIASNISGSSSTMLNAGWYLFNATPAQGKSLDQVLVQITQELKKLQEQPVTGAELSRAKNQAIANYILSNRDIGSQAQQLGYNQTVAGDYRFSDRYLTKLNQVTAADIQRVAKIYFQSDRRVVGKFEPTQVTAQGGNSGNPGAIQHGSYSPATPIDPEEVRRYLPASALTSRLTVQPIQPESFSLVNGLQVLLVSDRSTPSIILNGSIRAGTGLDPAPQAGTAALVAQTIMTGTKTQDALAIANSLEQKGASLGFSANREGVNIRGIALAQDLSLLLSQLGDVIQNATFPSSELELLRQRNLVALKSELDSPGSVARREFQQLVFPVGHPYHSMRTLESLQSITRQDLVNFYQTYYRPERTILTITGDFEPATVKRLLNQNLGKWARGNAPLDPTYPAVPLPPSQTKQVILPGKTQAVTIMGHRGITRRDRRYYAALVLNQVLGGDTLSSRLGTELRDRQGLTYGVYSGFQVGKQQGTFLIQMQTSIPDRERAIASALQIFRQVQQQGITAAEFKAAQTSLINSFPVDLASPDQVAGSFLQDQLLGLPPGDFYKFPEKISALSLAEVNQAAQQLLLPENLVIVSATSTPPQP